MKMNVIPEGILQETIKLQLKKPKNWNWQLSTSKSSPHIILPVIQLFDAKGQLLLEARDNGAVQRRSWHSSDFQKGDPLSSRLHRCSSEIIPKNSALRKSNSKSLESHQHCDAETIFNRRLQKSRSGINKGHVESTSTLDDRLFQKSESPSRYKRSRSDDLFHRKLKHNEESLKRAETDGYSQFLATPCNDNGVVGAHSIGGKYQMRTSKAGTLVICDEPETEGRRRRRKFTNAFHPDSVKERSSSPRPKVDIDTSVMHLKNRHKLVNHTNSKAAEVGLIASQSDTALFKNHETVISAKLSRKHRDGRAAASSHQKSRSRTKARAKDQSKDPNQRADSELLRLVRRLSTENARMGANVSRHSSKGLSGRRSQSSGSICNGKGKHAEGKVCGSLPNYLDDRNAAGCNNNHQEKPPPEEVQRIPPLGDGAPLHWKFADNQTVLCDQGYGSERSPEEEYPPPLPDHDVQCHHHLEPHACYPFITPESTFVVKLAKSSRGLGLSVTGGIDSGGSWPGLIRIKRLFPHQPASACGLLNVGDLILEANGITLTGLTNYEALEVLRTAPNQVELKVCRPPPDVLSCVSPISEVPPPPPRREPPSSLNFTPTVYSTPEDDYYHGEFEVILNKIQGSLGFTLRKEDDSALGHYVRALVREPALTDGRIKAGDKIIAVNNVEISSMTHEQAVQFLRQCGDVVKLRLYRDSAQTPVAALSPNETTPRTSFSKKTNLRQEAMDMLNDIAVRKLIPSNNNNNDNIDDEYCRRSLSPGASPRRLRRQPCPSDASQSQEPAIKYLISDEQFHEGLLHKCSARPIDDDTFNSLFSIDSDDGGGGDRPSRPSSLDLYNPNQTPVAARKPRFNFSLAHNAYELNNLDPEVLDAPNLTYNLGNDDVTSAEAECGDSFPKEPTSMPHIPIDNSGFSYKNPAYQSAHPQCGSVEIEEKTSKPILVRHEHSIKKWKGVQFDGDEKTSTGMPMEEEYEILAIELNRGWNSRLGFSLQGAAGVTYVSAVYSDSVAAKDGRIRPGDRVIKVNDESVEHMSTNEIIELLRIVRGPVCIVVSRIKSKEDCPKRNAEN